jgi:hypothetical protein
MNSTSVDEYLYAGSLSMKTPSMGPRNTTPTNEISPRGQHMDP